MYAFFQPRISVEQEEAYIKSMIDEEYAQMDKPQAIDVYKGNTTLEITYKDGVPTDSVVVYKD